MLDELSKLENHIYYVVGSHDFLKNTIQKLKSKNVGISDIVLDVRDEILKELFEG